MVTIARKSTSVKTPEEATELLNEIAVFLRPGEERQNERIKKISEFAVKLFGISQPKEVTQVPTLHYFLDKYLTLLPF